MNGPAKGAQKRAPLKAACALAFWLAAMPAPPVGADSQPEFAPALAGGSKFGCEYRHDAEHTTYELRVWSGEVETFVDGRQPIVRKQAQQLVVVTDRYIKAAKICQKFIDWRKALARSKTGRDQQLREFGQWLRLWPIRGVRC